MKWWDSIVRQHEVPAQPAREHAGHDRPDRETRRLLDAGRAEDRKRMREQQARWERTDPAYERPRPGRDKQQQGRTR